MARPAKFLRAASSVSLSRCAVSGFFAGQDVLHGRGFQRLHYRIQFGFARFRQFARRCDNGAVIGERPAEDEGFRQRVGSAGR